MGNTANVEIIKAKFIDVYRWFRNQGFAIKEAKEFAKMNNISFQDNYKKAIELYEYITSFGDTCAKIEINHFLEVAQRPACNCFLEEEIQKEIQLEKELE